MSLARDIIEAEDPKAAFRSRWGNAVEGMIQATFNRLRLPLAVRQPAVNGKTVCDEYTANVEMPGGDKLSVYLTVWRPDSRRTEHDLSVNKGYAGRYMSWMDVVHERSKDVPRLLRMLEYAVNFILPKIHQVPPKEAKRQAMALRDKAAYHIMVEAEDPKSFLKGLSAQQGDHRAPCQYHMSSGTKFYVVDQHGCITHYDYHTENAGGVYSFSGNWKVQGMSFHHWANHFTPWDTLCNRMARAGSVTGYLWDLDHGTTRRWGEKGTIYPVAAVRQEAEDPKEFLKKHAPPAQFEVEGTYQSWVADGQGNVLYDLEARMPRRAKKRSIKKFNVEEYHQRTGKWPSGNVLLQHISYWTPGGNYFICPAEISFATRPRPR